MENITLPFEETQDGTQPLRITRLREPSFMIERVRRDWRGRVTETHNISYIRWLRQEQHRLMRAGISADLLETYEHGIVTVALYRLDLREGELVGL